MEWADFCECFDSIDVCRIEITAEMSARRQQFRKRAEHDCGLDAGKREGKGQDAKQAEDGSLAARRAAADAMMEQLLREDAQERRLKAQKTHSRIHRGRNRRKGKGRKKRD